MLLEISQKSQQNTRARDSFLIKLKASACNRNGSIESACSQHSPFFVRNLYFFKYISTLYLIHITQNLSTIPAPPTLFQISGSILCSLSKTEVQTLEKEKTFHNIFLYNFSFKIYSKRSVSNRVK